MLANADSATVAAAAFLFVMRTQRVTVAFLATTLALSMRALLAGVSGAGNATDADFVVLAYTATTTVATAPLFTAVRTLFATLWHLLRLALLS